MFKPTFTFFAASILSSKSRGSVAPVSWCFDRRFRPSTVQHQFSSIWEGASTKSRGHLASVVELPSPAEHKPCMMCPNSWKNVTQFECRNNAGLPSAEGAGKLHNIQSTGTWSPHLFSR